MKTHYTVVLAMLSGIGIGGLTVEGIHAQARPPAYHIVEIDVTNEDIFNKQWAPKLMKQLKPQGAFTLCAVPILKGSKELVQSAS
jgi:hypothetical protein